ncbi:MAG TPA: hypothetical protein VGH54_06210 [Mycobacterium sp.]|jgi:hypothetical protein|uniref:hypothetical protein n=1 Tax=Mycobacterium sp. TaxID=1785 RepID=UPI002F40C6D4
MSARIVTEDVEFPWDGVTQRLTRGQMLDVVPDSALERAIGSQNLRPPGPIAPAPSAAPEPLAKAAAPAVAKPDEGKQDEAAEATPKKTAQATAKLAGTEGKESAS